MKDSDKQIKEMINWLFEQLQTKSIIIKRVYKDDYEKIDKCELPFIVMTSDIQVEEGDLVVIKEWDEKTKQETGRKLERRVLSVNKVDLTKYLAKALLDKGMKIIEI